jgi:porin
MHHRLAALIGAIFWPLCLAAPLAFADTALPALEVNSTASDANPPIAASQPPPLDETQALSFYGHWDSDAVNYFSGGLNTGFIYNSVAVGGVTFKGDALGLPRSIFNFSVMGTRTGLGAEKLLGDSLINPSNIEGDRNRIVLNTAFWQQNWLSQPGLNIATRTGVFDLSADFINTGNAGQLLNSSFGLDPAMTGNFTASTFPQNGSGVVATLDNRQLSTDTPPLTLNLGLIQGDVNRQTQPFNQGVLNIAEGQWQPEAGSAYKIGVWQKRGDDLATVRGSYLSAEHNLYSQGAQSLDGFLRASLASGARGSLQVSRYLSAGFNWQAPFTARPDDYLTVGFGGVRLQPTGQIERLFEAAYIIKLSPRIYLQPDIQYIQHPNGNLPNAWVGIVRLHIE